MEFFLRKVGLTVFLKCLFLLLLFFHMKAFCAVQIMSVKVPKRVKAGERVELSCRFDLEEKSLYSLNWWKGNQQFYQFSPAGSYHQTIYETPGIDVDKSKSSLKTVVLRNVSRVTSGPFKCEVVADFPSYERDSMSSSMEVVEVPSSPPRISIWRQQYQIGNILEANCTTPGSIPPPYIMWYINEKRVSSRYTTNITPRRDYYRRKLYNTSDDVLRPPPISSHVSVELKPSHFINGGRAFLICHAMIPELYHSSSEVQITLPGVSPAVPSQRVSTSTTIHAGLLGKILFILLYQCFFETLSRLFWPQSLKLLKGS